MAPQLTGSASQSFTTVLDPYMPIFYVSFFVTLILTPLMRRLAHQHGVIDMPDNKRKVHSQPIAYLGGVATFLGWLAGVCVSMGISPHIHADITVTQTVSIPPGVLIGAALVALFGLLDDVYSLAPRLKLTGQLLAAMALILPGAFHFGYDPFLKAGESGRPGSGVGWMLAQGLDRVTTSAAHGGIIDYVNHSQFWGISGAALVANAIPFLSGVFAIAVIFSTCNACNLLDGLDGLCSGVTGVMSLGYLILSLYLATGVMNISSAAGSEVDPVRITLSLALLGAVLGFLPYNFNPASIFMGDTGSMFLGFMCGVMILLFGQDGIFRWFLGSLVIFGLPMMDTLLAIIRRKLNGKPIFSPDSNHFHHFLIRQGFSVKRAVLLSYAIAATFVSFALVIVVIPTRIAMGVYLILFGWLIVIAFKMGMIYTAKKPEPVNASINASVITVDARPEKPSLLSEREAVAAK